MTTSILHSPRALLLVVALSTGCRDYAVEDMLDAYDDYREDHYVALVDAYEREGVVPPSRDGFDDLEQWHWEPGTKRRHCLVEKGESKRWRDHKYFPCLEEYLRDEEGRLYQEMRDAVDDLTTRDLNQLYDTTCAVINDADPGESFPYNDCLAMPGGD